MTQNPLESAITAEDQNHLNILSIFHFIAGGLAGLFSLFPVIHLTVGLGLVTGNFGGPPVSHQGPPMELFGWFFVLISLSIIIGGLALAGCIVMTGLFLKQRRYYTFCLVIAGVECIFMPIGTVLGVFTILVLMRDTVKRGFGR
jgi:hypothetical protein